jgi:hypothetical protein
MAVLEAELSPVNVGIDIGQVQDNTAICVTEIAQVPTGKLRHVAPVPAHMDKDGQWILPKYAHPVMASEYTVRHIARVPLGTSYPDVAILIADMLCSPLLEHRSVRVYLDITGVGRPVYEALKAEIETRKDGLWMADGSFLQKGKKWNVAMKPISFVHGESYNRKTGSLGKAYLVSRLQSLLQSGRVHAPSTPEVIATLDELRVYEIKISPDGKDQYGAFKTGAHDDLATCLGLSVLVDPFLEKVRYSNRVY